MTVNHKSMAVAIMGPTASGKNAAELAIAQRMPGEIISVDSMQVYRGLDIGTAKVMAVVAEVLPGGELRIAGLGSAPAHGLKRGVVVNIESTVQSIQRAIEEARRIFTTYIGLTRDMARRGAEYVIWPESATPFTFESDPVGEEAMRNLAREGGERGEGYVLTCQSHPSTPSVSLDYDA